MNTWPSVKLDEVARRGSGHTPSKQHPEYWNGSIRWVSLRDTNRLDHGAIYETATTITQAGLAHSSAVLHPAGSVVLLRDAGIGKGGVLGAQMAVSQHFMVWSCGPKLDNWFLYYVLQSRKPEFERISNGSTIKTIGLGYFRQMQVPLPEMDEQKRIAGALADIDRLIAAVDRQATKQQELKQGMMQQLLTGKTRLPGFTEPWTPRRLCEMLSYEQPGRYLVRTSRQLESGNTPVLTAGKTFVLGYTNEKFGIYTGHPVIIFDDFTTASKYVDFNFKAKSSAMKILSAKAGNNLRFLYERMQLIDFPLGDHKRYWISEYSEQELLVPGESEQAAIARVLADAEAEVASLRRRLGKAESIKQGMMQALLTGRVRLAARAAS